MTNLVVHFNCHPYYRRCHLADQLQFGYDFQKWGSVLRKYLLKQVNFVPCTEDII